MIKLDKAIEALKASETKAAELGITVSTAIVDDYGVLVAFSKMDGALHISPRYAYAKAFTSANLCMPTGDLGQYSGEGKPYFGFNTLFGGELTPIAGGVPVKNAGKIIGAVGVGGSPDVTQDAQCAAAAATVLER